MATPSFRTFNRRLASGVRASEAQYDPLVQAYRRSLRGAYRAAQRRLRAMSVELVAGAKFNPPDEDELFPRGDMAADVIRRTRRPREEAAKAVIRSGAAGIAFDVGGPFSERLLRMAGVRAEMMSVMARETVMGIIGQALTDGWTVPETADAIGKAIEEVIPSQATMLARTDLIGTQNGASVEAARLVYPDQQLMKVWLATDDERTRETHADADGQSVPLDQSFQVGDDLLDYPGDPNGSDEEVCNCRCTVIYEEMPAAPVVASALVPGTPFYEETLALLTKPVVASGGRGNIPFTRRYAMSATETEIPTAMPVANDWTATLAVEDVWTEDGRKLLGGTTRWRDLPLTLSAMVDTAVGHEGASVAGRIDSIERNGRNIDARGEFDSGEYGQEIKRMVWERTLRGVSVDLAVLEYELRDIETDEPLTEDEAFVRAMTGEPVGVAFLDSVIGMATVCPFQAIEGATIEVTAAARGPIIVRLNMTFDPYGGDEITASAAGLVPLHPPRSWFGERQYDGPTPFTVTAEGEVHGHLALWGECHIGIDHACIRPKPSPSKYAHYQLGCTLTAEGEQLPTGTLTMDTGHAPVGMGLTPRQVVSHYDNTGLGIADVTMHEDAFGPYVTGALRPDIPAAKVRALRAARMSGDWRKYPQGTDLAAILMVNVGGYEIPRTQVALVASASGDALEMVAAGIVDDTLAIDQLADDALHAQIDRIAASV